MYIYVTYICLLVYMQLYAYINAYKYQPKNF